VLTLSTCQFNGSTGALTIAGTNSSGKFLSITSI
jgi:hypothetical protein